jgi:tetratricopeptide (TPR) repeat protein
MTAAVLIWSVLLVVQSGEGVSPPSEPSSLVEERLEAVHKAPTDPRARLELGLAYAQVEEYDFAMAELVEAIKLNPENRDNLSAQANYHLGTVLLMLDRAPLAANAFREALRLGWKDVSVYLGLAQAFSKQGKFEEAALQYREALRLAPQMTGLHASLALMLEASGHIDEAITHYELYLQSAPAEAQHGIEVIRQRLANLKERRKM